MIGGKHGLARECARPEEGHESFELEGALVLLVAQNRHIRYTEDMNLLVRAYLFRLVLPRGSEVCLKVVADLEVAVLCGVSLERRRGTGGHRVLERVLKLQAALLSPVYFVELFQPECALVDFVGSLPDLLVTIVGPSLFLVLLKLSDKAEALKTDQVEDYLV